MRHSFFTSAAMLILACVAFAGGIVWMTRPRTHVSARFTEAAFRGIRSGDLEVEVLQRLGPPLSRRTEVTSGEWCFEAGTIDPHGWRQHVVELLFRRSAEPVCIYFDESGTVRGVRREA